MADFNPPDERRSAAVKRQDGLPIAPRQVCSGTAGDRKGNGAIAERAPRRQPQDRPQQSPRQAYAAIDLGTNNCRLLIARPQDQNFVVIDAFSRVVRLGEGLAQTGELSQAAMDRAVGALKVCADKLKRRNVRLARSVATEACRRASNGEAFIDRVRQELQNLETEYEQLEAEINKEFHPYWGSLLKEMNGLSIFGQQVDLYADIYMRRVSCLGVYSPTQFFRSPHDLMPHEI